MSMSLYKIKRKVVTTVENSGWVVTVRGFDFYQVVQLIEDKKPSKVS